jgi:membrane-bound lytic murein transglycosylase B
MNLITPRIVALFLTLAIFAAYTNEARADASGFPAWLESFKARASQNGIQPIINQGALNNVSYLPRVIELDRKQPEGTMTFAKYRERVVSQARIDQGRAMLRKHRALLDRVSADYGVPPQYIVALWGIETSYGKITGNFKIVDSLATLAYEGRRAEFFTAELIKALKIIQQGHITKDRMLGSWAGAMGQSQFMPSSFLAYAQDYNGDGRRDIWSTQEDVFASMANYLAQSGWKGDERWGREVRVPSSISESMMDRKNKKTLAQWRSLGVTLPNGQPIPVVEGMRGALVAPDGYPAGPVYLVYDNYDVIMKWNRSTYFATSVGLLADLIAMAL